jgi:transposase
MRGRGAFAVSPTSLIELMARGRATGSVAPARYGGRPRRMLVAHERVLRRRSRTSRWHLPGALSAKLVRSPSQ